MLEARAAALSARSTSALTPGREGQLLQQVAQKRDELEAILGLHVSQVHRPCFPLHLIETMKALRCTSLSGTARQLSKALAVVGMFMYLEPDTHCDLCCPCCCLVRTLVQALRLDVSNMATTGSFSMVYCGAYEITCRHAPGNYWDVTVQRLEGAAGRPGVTRDFEAVLGEYGTCRPPSWLPSPLKAVPATPRRRTARLAPTATFQ